MITDFVDYNISQLKIGYKISDDNSYCDIYVLSMSTIIRQSTISLLSKALERNIAIQLYGDIPLIITDESYFTKVEILTNIDSFKTPRAFYDTYDLDGMFYTNSSNKTECYNVNFGGNSSKYIILHCPEPSDSRKPAISGLIMGTRGVFSFNIYGNPSYTVANRNITTIWCEDETKYGFYFEALGQSLFGIRLRAKNSWDDCTIICKQHYCLGDQGHYNFSIQFDT